MFGLAARHGDAPDRVQDTLRHDLPVTFAQVHARQVNVTEPGVIARLGEMQEDPAGNDAGAVQQQFTHQGWPQHGQASERLVGRVPALSAREARREFQRRSFWRGDEYRPGQARRRHDPHLAHDGNVPAGFPERARYQELPGDRLLNDLLAVPGDLQWEVAEPGRGSLEKVEVQRVLATHRLVMAQALQGQRAQVTDMNWNADLLGCVESGWPRERKPGAQVGLPGKGLKPPCAYVMVNQGAADALSVQPADGYGHPFGQMVAKSGQGIRHALILYKVIKSGLINKLNIKEGPVPLVPRFTRGFPGNAHAASVIQRAGVRAAHWKAPVPEGSIPGVRMKSLPVRRAR